MISMGVDEVFLFLYLIFEEHFICRGWIAMNTPAFCGQLGFNELRLLFCDVWSMGCHRELRECEIDGC